MKYDIKSSKYIGIEPEPVNKNFLAMDRTMQEGYGHDMNGDIVKAAQCWKSVFEDLKMYMEEHQLTDLKSFDDIFNGTQYVGNWVQDYDDTLRNVLVEADKSSRKEVGRQKIELLEFLIGLNIPDELSLHNHKRSLAETYYMLGQPEVGERHYLDLMEAYPDNVWGYVGYADEYWLNESGIRDYDKAYRLLDVAYNRLTIEDSDIIVERLTDLTLNMKKKELAEFLDSGKALEGSGERPIVPEYRDLYQKLFRLREDRRGISPVKTRANPTHYEQPLVKGKKIGRNAPCPCGSGKKYKKCCGK